MTAKRLKRVLKDWLYHTKEFTVRWFLAFSCDQPIKNEGTAGRWSDQAKKHLGQGGFSTARLAHDTDNHRLVALNCQIHIVQRVNPNSVE
jgi:hypothetical protein